MEETLVSLEVARLLWKKELPKTEVIKHCTYVTILEDNIIEYLPMIPQSLAQKWLRDNKDIVVLIDYCNTTKTYSWYIAGSTKGYNSVLNTYEEALEEGLKEALKLI